MQTEQALRGRITVVHQQTFDQFNFISNPCVVTEDYRNSPCSLWLNKNEAVLISNNNPDYEVFENAANPEFKKENVKTFYTLFCHKDICPVYFVELKNSVKTLGTYIAGLRLTQMYNTAIKITMKITENLDNFLSKQYSNVTFLNEIELEKRGKNLNKKREDFYAAFMGTELKQPDSLFNLALSCVFKNKPYKSAILPDEVSEKFTPLEEILKIKTKLAMTIQQFSVEEYEKTRFDNSKTEFTIQEIPVPQNSDSQYFDLVISELLDNGEDKTIGLNQILKIHKRKNTCLLFEPLSLQYYNEFETLQKIATLMQQHQRFQLILLSENSPRPLKTLYDATSQEPIMAPSPI